MSRQRKPAYKLFRPGTYVNIRTSDGEYLEQIQETIARNYVNTIVYNKERINRELLPFYSKPLNIADDNVGEVVDKILKMKEETHMEMAELAQYIRTYMGYQVEFFINKEGRKIPVTSDRLLKAYKAIKAKFPKSLVENILFK